MIKAISPNESTSFSDYASCPIAFVIRSIESAQSLSKYSIIKLVQQGEPNISLRPGARKRVKLIRFINNAKLNEIKICRRSNTMDTMVDNHP